MPEGGDLTISTRRVNEHVEVAFSDTGTGIASEDMKKLFDPLFTTKTQGTGLGLAKHGGSIEVTSKWGEGATFTVTLPLNGNQEQEA